MHSYELSSLSLCLSFLYYSNFCVPFVWENSEIDADYVLLEKVQNSRKKVRDKQTKFCCRTLSLTDGNALLYRNIIYVRLCRAGQATD